MKLTFFITSSSIPMTLSIRSSHSHIRRALLPLLLSVCVRTCSGGISVGSSSSKSCFTTPAGGTHQRKYHRFSNFEMSSKRKAESNVSSNADSTKKQQKSLTNFFHSTSSSSTSTSSSPFKSTSARKVTVAEQALDIDKSRTAPHPYHIFLDLDGVLVDFQAGVRPLFPNKYKDRDYIDLAAELPARVMWGAIAKTPNFYLDLPWTADGKELWNAVKHTHPEILTGVPMQKVSRTQKYHWCRREFQNAEMSDDKTNNDSNGDGEIKETVVSGRKLTFNHVDMAGGKRSHQCVNGGVRMKRENGVVNVITCWSKNKHCESGPQK